MTIRAGTPANFLKGNKIGGGSVPNWSDSQNNVARQLMMYYQLGGLSKAGAAGVVGNQYQESGLNSSEGGGYLSQWLGSRLANLQSFAHAIGKPVTSVEAQAKFTVRELQQSYPSLYKYLQTTKNPRDAALRISNEYERPAAAAANNSNRQNQAEAAFVHIAGGPQSGTASTSDSGGGGTAPGSILDLLTSPVDAIGGWLASIALNLVKDTAIGFVDVVIIPFWHWNQRAVDNYQVNMFSDKTGEVILWNGAFWGLGYWLLFTDPESGSLKAAPVRKSRLARHVRFGQSIPARKSIIKPKHVKSKTTKKPEPITSTAAIKQVDTMHTDRPQTVKVTSSERIKQRGEIDTNRAQQDRRNREDAKREQAHGHHPREPHAKH